MERKVLKVIMVFQVNAVWTVKKEKKVLELKEILAQMVHKVDKV
jgi:hypothetical protein